MKNLKVVLGVILLSFFVASCGIEKPKEKFSFVPENPKQNELITVRFNPDSTKLENSEIIKAFAYFYNNDLYKTEEAECKNEDGIYKATFKTDSLTKGIVFKFTDEEGRIIDNNNSEGYVVKLYDGKGNILPGATAGLAMCYAEWGYNLDMDNAREKAFTLFEEEFSKNKDEKNNYLRTYLFLINRLNSAQADSLIKLELAELEKDPNLDEEKFEIMVNWFTRLKSDKAKIYEQKFKEKFPTAEYFQMQKYSAFRAAELKDKTQLADEFNKLFPNSEIGISIYGRLFNELITAGKIEEAKTIYNNHKSNLTPTFYFRAINQLTKNGNDLDFALELAKTSETLALDNLTNPKEKQPEFLSTEEWVKDRDLQVGYAKFNLAKILIKQNNTGEAFKNLEAAYKHSRGNDPEINILFSENLIANGDYKKAQTILEKDIKNGLGNEQVEKLIQQAYENNKNNKGSFDKYLAELKAFADAELSEKINKGLIDLPAPDFTLLDVNGKSFTFSELKGKVVIVDFWATWCSPCIQSFPVIKLAIEKYKNNPNVKFVFINTWETVDNKVKNAKDFLTKNNYDFQVLMDEKNKVVESFKVTGIPTKFFVDKNGRIRFKSVGFSGNAEETLKEIDLIIDKIK